MPKKKSKKKVTKKKAVKKKAKKKVKKLPPHPRATTRVQTSPFALVRKSSIHNKGVFAKKDIPKGTKILQYVGKYITKEESDTLADVHMDSHKKDKAHGAVYIFELNKSWDIDGNVSYNTARLINHSCDPNCEAKFYKQRIWITAIKNIKKGDELNYDYGYDFEDWQDHRCLCGSDNCLGYIVSEEFLPKLKRKLRKLTKEGKKPRYAKNFQ